MDASGFQRPPSITRVRRHAWRIAQRSLAQGLDGDVPVDVEVLGAVDLTHGPLTDFFLNDVAADFFHQALGVKRVDVNGFRGGR